VNRDGHFVGRILTPGLGSHPILMRKFGILLLVAQKLVLLLFAPRRALWGPSAVPPETVFQDRRNLVTGSP
jgi:hypothetical protein